MIGNRDQQKETKFNENDGFNKFVGLTGGAILFGGIALALAPIAVPAVVGLLGVAASPAVMTAITAGVVALSAGAGATVGYFTGNEAVPAVEGAIEKIFNKKSSKEDDDISVDRKPDQRQGGGQFESHKRNTPQLRRDDNKDDVSSLQEIIRTQGLDLQTLATKNLQLTLQNKTLEAQQEALTRKISIYGDLLAAPDEVFLNFLDKYRQKAVTNILSIRGITSVEKKSKIEAIFRDTTYSYESDDFTTLRLPKNSATQKAEIIKAIIANPDFPSIDDDVRNATRNRQASFSTDELIKRTLIFRLAVGKILNSSADDPTKENALRQFVVQHSNNGSLKNPETLKVQKKAVNNIFDTANIIANSACVNNDIITEVFNHAVLGATSATNGAAAFNSPGSKTSVAIVATTAATNTSVDHFAKAVAADPAADVAAAAVAADPVAVAAVATAAAAAAAVAVAATNPAFSAAAADAAATAANAVAAKPEAASAVAAVAAVATVAVAAAKPAASAAADAAAKLAAADAAAKLAAATATTSDPAVAAVAAADLTAAAVTDHPNSSGIVDSVVATANVQDATANITAKNSIKAAISQQIRQKTFDEYIDRKFDELVRGFLDPQNFESDLKIKKSLFGDDVDKAYDADRNVAVQAKADGAPPLQTSVDARDAAGGRADAEAKAKATADAPKAAVQDKNAPGPARGDGAGAPGPDPAVKGGNGLAAVAGDGPATLI